MFIKSWRKSAGKRKLKQGENEGENYQTRKLEMLRKKTGEHQQARGSGNREKMKEKTIGQENVNVKKNSRRKSAGKRKWKLGESKGEKTLLDKKIEMLRKIAGENQQARVSGNRGKIKEKNHFQTRKTRVKYSVDCVLANSINRIGTVQHKSVE